MANQFTYFGINKGKSRKNEYASFLETHNLKYQETEHYLSVGSAAADSTVPITISVIRSEIERLFIRLLPELKSLKHAFEMVKDYITAKKVLDGVLGEHHIGKVIIIYLPVNKNYNQVVKHLIELTQPFKGPQVPNSINLGACVYMQTSDINSHRHGNLIQSLKQKYIILKTLSKGFKGHVFKAFYLKGFFKVVMCVIKQGRRNMISDHIGRDMKDRLLWQMQVHNTLSNLVNIPRVLDFFEEDNDHYLVLEFIDGKPLSQVISQVYSGQTWLQLSADNKARILDLLLKELKLIAKLHGLGYVHRDLTPVNLLSTKAGDIYLLDFELSYNLKTSYPSPPFELGTFGFMSPQQIKIQTPNLADDVYGIGALMLFFFTNRPPAEHNLKYDKNLRQLLTSLIGESNLADIIASCLSPNVNGRPKLSDILDEIARINYLPITNI